MDIHAEKLELIRMVMETESKELLAKFRRLWKQAEKENGKGPQPPNVAEEPEPEWIRLAREPMPEHLDVEALAKEQGYDGKRLSETLKNWDQSLFEDQTLEELLNSLTK